MSVHYTVNILDINGNLKHGNVQFSTLDYSRKENEVGVAKVVLPPIWNISDFMADDQIEIRRSLDSGPELLEMETIWFIRHMKFNKKRVELTGYDLLSLVNRRIIAYAAGTAYTNKTDNADDMMKAFVRENMGSLATDTARILPDFAVDYDLAAAPSITLEKSYKNLLPALQDICKASEEGGYRVVFDVVWLAKNTFEFRTYLYARGTDHRTGQPQPVIISEDFKNLTNPDIDIDYTSEVNSAYAGGGGTGSERIVKNVKDLVRSARSPFNLCEAFVDSRNTNLDTATAADAALTSDANAELAVGAPKISFTGNIQDNRGTRYGRDYKYGDRVTAQYLGYYFDCYLNSIKVSVSNAGEKITSSLKGELTL